MSKKRGVSMNDSATRATGQLGEYSTMQGPGERPFSEIVSDIVGHAQEIIRGEIRLAKTEVKQEAGKAARASTLLIGGAVVGLFAISFLLWTVVYAIGLVLPMWASALVVGVVLGTIGSITLKVGIRRIRQVEPVPDKAVQQVKEDVAWLKQQTK